MKKYMCLIGVYACMANIYAQNIPLPLRCFPLNGNGVEIMTGNSLTDNGWGAPIADRWGKMSCAVSFSGPGATLKMDLLPDSLTRKGMTVSFWMCTQATDSGQLVYGKDEKGRMVMGLEQVKNRLVLNMYHTLFDGSFSENRLWLWKDLEIGKEKDWYFVSLSFSEEGTTICLAGLKREISSCYSSFVPDWRLLDTWGIGNEKGTNVEGMDDFRVYSTALGVEEVTTLYEQEKKLSFGPYEMYNKKTGESLSFQADEGSPHSTWYLFCTGAEGEDGLFHFLSETGNAYLGSDGYAMLLNEQHHDVFRIGHNDVENYLTISDVDRGMDIVASEGRIHLQGGMGNIDSGKWHIGEIKGATRSLVLSEQAGTSSCCNVRFDKTGSEICVDVVLEQVEDILVSIYSMDGTMLNKRVVYGAKTLFVSFPWKSKGVYIVSVHAGAYVANKRVIVE